MYQIIYSVFYVWYHCCLPNFFGGGGPLIPHSHFTVEETETQHS